MWASGKCSSCALCSATSSTRATTCTPPARLCVGAYRIARSDGVDAAGRGDFHRPAAPAAACRLRAPARPSSPRRAKPSSSNSFSLRASARAGPEPRAKNDPLPVAVRQAPAGILAGKAGGHRVGRRNRDRPRPARQRGIRPEPHLAQPAQANRREAQARRDTALMVGAGIDETLAGLAARDADTQRRGVRTQRVHQPPGAVVQAKGRIAGSFGTFGAGQDFCGAVAHQAFGALPRPRLRRERCKAAPRWDRFARRLPIRGPGRPGEIPRKAEYPHAHRQSPPPRPPARPAAHPAARPRWRRDAGGTKCPPDRRRCRAWRPAAGSLPASRSHPRCTRKSALFRPHRPVCDTSRATASPDLRGAALA